MNAAKKISIAIAAQFERSFESAFSTADDRVNGLTDRVRNLERQSSSMKGLEILRTESIALAKAVTDAEQAVSEWNSKLELAKKTQKDASDKTKDLSQKVKDQSNAYEAAKEAHKKLDEEVKASGSATKQQTKAIREAWTEVKRQKQYWDDARKSLQDHTREAKRNETELRRNGESLDDLNSGLKETKGELNSAKVALDRNTSAVTEHEQVLKKAGRGTADLASEQKKLGRELDAVSRKLALEAQSKKYGDLQKSLRGEIVSTGFEVVAMGMAFAKPLTIAAQFEHSMAKVGAQTMATGEQLNKLEQAARALGDKTIFSSSQAAEAQGFLAQAGFQVQEILDSLEGVLGLAAAGDTGLAETAEMASNMLSGFSLDATEMLRVADTMTATFISSNTNLTQLAETMKYVAPIASALGASLEEVSAESGLLGNVGIQGSMAGTALRAMYNRLSDPPTGAQEMLDKLKISTMDAQKNLRPMPEILKELDKAMTGLGTAEKAEIIKKLFGEEAAAAATELVKKAGTGSLEFEIKKLELAPAYRSAAKKIQDDMSTAELKDLGISIKPEMDKGQKVKELFKAFDGLSGQDFEKKFDKVFKFKPTIDKTELQTESKAAQQSLKKLGVSTMGQDGQAKSFADLTKEIEKALARLPEPDRLAHVNALFSKSRDSMHALALEAAKGGESFSGLADGLEKTNSAAEIADRLNRTTVGQWKTFQSGLEAVAISVGSIFLPAMSSLMQTISPLLLQFAAFVEQHETIVKVLGFAVIALIANKAALLAYKSALWLGAGAIDLVTKAQKAWNFIASMNPVGLIIMGVAALGYAAYKVYEHWDQIEVYVMPIWQKLKAMVVAFWHAIEPVAQFHPLGFIIKNWEPIVGFFQGLYARLKPIIDPIVNFFTEETAKVPEIQVPTIEQRLTWKSDGFGDFIAKSNLAAKAPASPGGLNFDSLSQTGHKMAKVIDFPAPKLNLNSLEQQRESASWLKGAQVPGTQSSAAPFGEMEPASNPVFPSSTKDKDQDVHFLSKIKMPQLPALASGNAERQKPNPKSSFTLHQNVEIKIEGGESAPKQTAERLKKEVRSAFSPSTFNLFDPVGT